MSADVKSLPALNVAQCLAVMTGLFKDVGLGSKDLDSLYFRSASEGLSFLTKTLPKLGKAFDKALGDGIFKLPSCFKKQSKGSQIPAFCGSLFRAVFGKDGVIRSEPSIDAIRWIRQICFLFYKEELPYKESQTDKQLEQFMDTDQVVGKWTPDNVPLALLDDARFYISEIMSGFNPREIKMKHSKGVTSDTYLTDKHQVVPAFDEDIARFFGFWHWYTNVGEDFPYFFLVKSLYPLMWSLCGVMPKLRKLKKQSAPVRRAKGIFVPKDSRGPRFISAEPCIHQFVQQGIADFMVTRLESHPFTRGFVNFTDQSVNQNLALRHSEDQAYSTLDLKDASDRISFRLVQELFKDTPVLLEALTLSRSKETVLPFSSGDKVVALQKFAPMGSACCFPVLSLCVWSLLKADISGISSLCSPPCDLYVYGDDVVVPTWYAWRAIQVLEAFGLLVNTDKSFIGSKFLESCGMDAYDGHPVSPVRSRHLALTNFKLRHMPDPGIVSVVALANGLMSQGYSRAAHVTYQIVERTLGPLPVGTWRSGYLCREVTDYTVSSNERVVKVKFGRQTRGFNAWTVQSTKVELPELGYSHLKRVLPLMGQELIIPGINEWQLPHRIKVRRRFIIED